MHAKLITLAYNDDDFSDSRDNENHSGSFSLSLSDTHLNKDKKLVLKEQY